jgi:Ran GTPase-activating protein (RanGAP) involved in mRNA processing and transport
LEATLSLIYLQSILQHNIALQHLNISDNALNLTGRLGLLAKGIHNLQTLKCASCGLGDVAMQALFPPISFEDELEVEEELSLPPGAASEATKSSKLEELDLCENRITSQGIQALVPYLQHPKFQIKSL